MSKYDKSRQELSGVGEAKAVEFVGAEAVRGRPGPGAGAGEARAVDVGEACEGLWEIEGHTNVND